jgi:hypothetical protein
MSNSGPKKNAGQSTFVELSTWGTHHHGGNGMAHYLDAQLLGGNVGHAAIRVTFPADKAGEELVTKYCRKDGVTVIPFERTTMQVKDENNKVVTQEVFKVNFSWWPGEKKGYELNANPNQDSAQEREGVDVGQRAVRFTVPDDPHALEKAEERIGRGWVGSVNNHLAPTRMTMDISSLEPRQQDLLKAEEKKEQLVNKIETLEVILKKLPEDAASVPAAGTLLKLLNKHQPDWKTRIGLANDAPTPKSFTQENMAVLRAAIKTQITAVNKQKSDNQVDINALTASIQFDEQQKRADEVDVLARVLANYTPYEQKKKLEERSASFPARVWNAYESDLVKKEIKELMPLTELLGQNYEYATDEESKQTVDRALFDGKLPEHLDAESALHKVNSRIGKLDKLLGNKLIELEKQENPELKKHIQATIDNLNAKKISLIKDQAFITSTIQKANEKVGNMQTAFRALLPREHRNVTRDTMSPEIFNAVKAAANEKRLKLKTRDFELQNEAPVLSVTDGFHAGGYERFITQGLAPDNLVLLPVSNVKADNGPQAKENARRGLNVENMLAKMRELTEDGKEFDLNTKNCSATTGEVLAAGAGPELKSYMQQKAWGGFGNPQEVFNGAVQYQEIVSHKQGKIPFGDKVAAYNPLNAVSYVGGTILRKLVSPDVPMVAKVALGVALVPAGLAAGVVEGAKACTNPLKTLNNSVNFIKYAWDSNSTVLKVLSAPAALVVGVLSPFAGVQFAAKKAIVDPIANAIQKQKTEYAQNNDPNKVEIQHDPQVQERTKKVKPISETTPTLILRRMDSVLNKSQSAIPEPTPRSRAILDGDLTNSKRHALHDMQGKIRKRIYSSEQPLPPTPTQNEGPLPPTPKQSSKERYGEYKNKVEAAVAVYGDKVKLESLKDFRKHPNLLSAYAEQLQKDVKDNKADPTVFKVFKAEYKDMKKATSAHEVFKEAAERPKLVGGSLSLHQERAPKLINGQEVEPIDRNPDRQRSPRTPRT